MQISTQTFPLERTEARSVLFTEQEAFWTLSLHETAVISDVAVTRGECSSTDRHMTHFLFVNESHVLLHTLTLTTRLEAHLFVRIIQ